MPSIIDRVLKISDNRVLRRMQGTVDAVNLLEEDFRALSDAELRAETDTLKARHADGESLDLLLPEAFAAVREASRRTLGLRHLLKRGALSQSAGIPGHGHDQIGDGSPSRLAAGDHLFARFDRLAGGPPIGHQRDQDSIGSGNRHRGGLVLEPRSVAQCQVMALGLSLQRIHHLDVPDLGQTGEGRALVAEPMPSGEAGVAISVCHADAETRCQVSGQEGAKCGFPAAPFAGRNRHDVAHAIPQ